MLTEDRQPTAPAADPDLAEAAAWLGCSARTLERHRRDTGRPAGYRVGHKLRFSYAELAEWQEQRRTEQRAALDARVAERQAAAQKAAAEAKAAEHRAAADAGE